MSITFTKRPRNRIVGKVSLSNSNLYTLHYTEHSPRPYNRLSFSLHRERTGIGKGDNKDRVVKVRLAGSCKVYTMYIHMQFHGD